MSEPKKTQKHTGPGQGAYQKSSDGVVNSILTLLENQALESPAGHWWTRGEVPEMLRQLINNAILDNPSPGVKIQLIPSPPGANGWAALRIFVARWRFNVIVLGWSPVYQANASDLLQRIDDAWQSSVGVGEALQCLDRLTSAHDLLTAGRMFAMESLQQAEKQADDACVPLMDDIQSPDHWVNTIPEGSQIGGLCFDTDCRGRDVSH